MSAAPTEQVLRRVCSEYLEMPGLRLTRRQAQRLWGLDETACTEVLEFLVCVNFLRRTDAGTYIRAGEGRLGDRALAALYATATGGRCT
jgi:hypothetical protein